MIKNYLRKRRHVRFIHSRIYTLKYELLNMSLKMTDTSNEDDILDIIDNMRNKAVLFKKYNRKMKWLQF